MAKIVTPETKIKIVNNSAIKDTTVVSNYTGPTYLIVSAAPKGTESMTIIEPSQDGETFFTKFGKKPSFVKYGQALLMAGILAEKEARIIFKRIVASDSTLGNVVIYGQITSTEVQKTDNDGYLLYTDANGDETIVAEGNTPLMEKNYKIKYTGKSFPGIKTIKQLSNIVKSTLDEEAMIYPLFIITDNGRGVSVKRVRVSSDYASSKKLSYMKYNIEVIENSEKIETLEFSSNPDIEEYEENLSIKTVISQYSDQIQCDLFESYWEMMAEKLSEVTPYSFDYLMNIDLFNCKDRSGTDLVGLTIDNSDGYLDLSYTFGFSLDNGSNGSFGTNPVNTTQYSDELVKFFTGELTSDIYDIDNYKIDVIPDANYPIPVKKVIKDLCEYRIDPFYFQDMGISNTNYTDILSEAELYQESEINDSMFCATNHLFYDITDPYSKKQITVTNTLELCENLIEHFKNGRSRPFAGLKYKIQYNRWIPGTENFIPINLPVVKQRDSFNDSRINYAVKYDGKLVQDTQITSDKEYSEASFINNIMNVQNIIKEIRTVCPANRYAFIEAEDLEEYQETVNTKVISKHTAEFKSIGLVYLEDKTAKKNKVYTAAINVEFKDFDVQEQFTIYLNNSNS